MNIVVVSNPSSGKVLNNKPSLLSEQLHEAGFPHDFYQTTAIQNAYHIVSKFETPPDILIVSGGDGTVSEVIQALHQRSFKTPILIVPNGTSNELAKNFGLTNDINKVIETLRNGKQISVDYGLFNSSKTFSYALSFGTFTELTYKTPQKLKNIFGFFAYVLYGFFTFRKIEDQYVTVESDDKKIEGSFTFGGVFNSNTIGNVIDMNPQKPILDDGYFEVFLIKSPHDGKSYRRILKSLRTNNYQNESFISFKARSVTFNSHEKLNWNIDGENGGDHQSIDVSNQEKMLTLLVPKNILP